ncbi:MAG: hypothetical protein ACPGTU_07100 [Myxococcota bacterium]
MNKHTLVILGTLALVFGPNLVHLHTGALGASGADGLKHVWSQWWVVNQLLEEGRLSLHTKLIHHPIGGDFFSLDTFNALFGLPIRAVFDPVPTYNVLLILNLGLAAFACRAFARTFINSDWAATFAGIAFAFSAWSLSFPVASGVSETAVFWPMPLILMYSIRTWKNSGWTSPVLAGLLLSVQGLACWSHGITAGLLLLGMWAAAMFSDRTQMADRERLRRIAVLVMTSLLVAWPAYMLISGTVQGDEAIKARTLSLFHSAPIGPLAVPEANSMALADFFLPGSWGLRTNSVGTERLMYAAYPGWIVLILSISALRSRTRTMTMLAIGAGFMMLMAMGPRIYLDHERSLLGLPNPIYLLTYYVVPLVNVTIHSVDRFVQGLMLCLALLAAHGFTRIHAKWHPWIVGAMVLEIILISPAPWPLPMVQAHNQASSIYLATQPGPGAVIDLPFLEGDGEQTRFLGDVFLQQTVHGKPIPFQLEGQGLETASPQIAANPFFRNVAGGLVHGSKIPSGCNGVNGLTDLGFEWVVWRPKLAPDSVRTRVDEVLRNCLENPQEFQDSTVFEIPN